MGQCDSLITKDITVTCGDVITKGVEANGVIVNRQDIDFGAVVFDTARKNVIKTLALKTGKKAYKVFIPGQTPFTGTKVSLEKGTYQNTFTNDVNIVILDNDPDVCADIIDGLANGEFVVIQENKFKNVNKATTPGDSAFQIYGYYQGLFAETLENDKYSDDTQGGWSVALKESKAPKAGLFLYNTDYDTTKKAIDTLTSTPAA